MKSPDTQFADELVEEIITRDFYAIRDLDPYAFDTVIDLGANLGVFSMAARFQFPAARIIAVEAWPKLWPYLRENVAGFGVEVVQKPIGTGQLVKAFTRNDVNPGCTIFGKGGSGDDYTDSTTFAQLTRGVDLSRTLVKIDIEGSERQLFTHKETVELLRQCKHIVAETHFGPSFIKADTGWVSATACDETLDRAFRGTELMFEHINRHQRKDTTKEDASGLLVARRDQTKGLWISRCARCHRDHYVEPLPLDNHDKYTRWARCPNTGQPILIQDVDD